MEAKYVRLNYPYHNGEGLTPFKGLLIATGEEHAGNYQLQNGDLGNGEIYSRYIRIIKPGKTVSFPLYENVEDRTLDRYGVGRNFGLIYASRLADFCILQDVNNSKGVLFIHLLLING